MKDKLSPETFAHLAELAALQLDAEEAEYLRQQLNNQLNAIHELEATPLDEEIKVTAHGVPFPPGISPALREDIWDPYPNPEEIIGQAPQADDGYIIVPDIPTTDLE